MKYLFRNVKLIDENYLDLPDLFLESLSSRKVMRSVSTQFEYQLI